MIGMILAAYGIGLVVAMPPGAVVITTGQRALTGGFWHAFVFNMGSIVADTFYALMVYVGVAALVANNNALRFILWVVGGAWLIYMGADAMRTRIDMGALEDEGSRLPRWRNFRSGLFITLLNPLTVVSWIALAGNFFNTVWRADWPPVQPFGLFAVIAMLIGALSWVIFVALVLSLIRKRVSPRVLKWISIGSGIFLVIYGLSAWASAAQMVLGVVFQGVS